MDALLVILGLVIVIGLVADDRVEVVDGLSEGDSVIVG